MNLDFSFPFFPSGEIRGEMRDARTGDLLQTFEEHVSGEIANLVVRRAAIGMVAALVPGSQSLNVSHVAVGTGTTAASTTQTQLVAEIARVVPTLSFDTTTTGVQTFVINGVTYSNILQVAATFDESVVGNLTELGLFIGGSGTANSGCLFARKTFSAWNKSSSSSLSFLWKVTF